MARSSKPTGKATTGDSDKPKTKLHRKKNEKLVKKQKFKKNKVKFKKHR